MDTMGIMRVMMSIMMRVIMRARRLIMRVTRNIRDIRGE